MIAGVGVGLAERGQRRVEGPLLGWIRFELDSYIDPDSLTLHCALGKKPPQGSSIWLYGGPNVPVSKSRPVCLELLRNRLPESPGRDRGELELRQSALSMLGAMKGYAGPENDSGFRAGHRAR